MPAITSVYELESGWRQLTDGERRIAEVLLSRARALVADAYEEAGIDFGSISANKREIASIVECDMVRNAFIWAQRGASSIFGEVAETETWEQPEIAGWLRITDSQREQLGLVTQCWTIQPRTAFDGR